MFVVKRDQIEAFRLPMREAARDKLIADLADDNVQVSPDKKTLIQTDEAGNKTTLSYSADVLPATITKPSGVRYQMAYDNDGRLSQFTYPSGEQLGFTFNEGQLQRVGTSPDKSYRFDYNKGRLTRVIYPGQKSQQFVYTDFGDLSVLVDRTGQTHRFTRTPDGQLQAIHDPLNRSVRFIYDEEGLLSDLVFPDQTRQSYQYDQDADILHLQLRDGKQFSQHYNGEQITQLRWEQGPTVRFDYNEQNQPTLIDSGTYAVRFAYDELNRLISEASPAGSTAFAYDKASRLTQLTLPTGLAVGYIYDSNSRIVGLQVAGQVVQFIYNEQDLLAEIRYPNGVTEYQQRNHTEGLRHVRVQNGRGRLLCEQSYAYDSWDRLSRYQDAAGKQNFQLTYDDESRLTGLLDAQTRQLIERFSYDAKGNLTVFNGHPVQVGYMDEVRQIGRMNVHYDALGNVIRVNGPKGKLRLSFARNSTLASVETQSSGTWRYEYDGIGRRISKTNGIERWQFAWAGSQLVIETYESQPGAAPLVREYVYLPDSQVPVAFRESNQLYWMQADVRGAITYVYDQQGQVVWHGSYSAFGELTIHHTRIRQPWRLMGQYEDSETGLYYNLARYYCPWLTTYLSLDPEWLNPETYYYSYARNDPYNRADPLGNIAPWLIAIGVKSIVSGIIDGVQVASQGGGWRDVLGAVVKGTLITAGNTIGTLLGGRVGPLGARVGGAIGTGIGTFLGELAEQVIKGEEISVACALKEAGSAALSGALPSGKRSKANANNSQIKNIVSKAPKSRGTKALSVNELSKHRKKSKRLQYVGKTPSKNSATGEQVKERMRNEKPPRYRVVKGKGYFKSRKDGEWYPEEVADMAHHPKDAVDYWNQRGKYHGPKSKPVRDWMKNSKNYELEHRSYNRSEGAKSGKRYQNPVNKG
ncbi:Wall-associated protein [Fibrisoma limi BUZ 3]|uniref:Wall-associated protein n=1 Tax=Fibrisoma limi BUZ 3 TaxID=1185876 RepID=I2GM24_9BACT|nr:RHS repeat-associated core domain-containing protein [Fibrisoma limi]CCH54950.1 Wall-associated protein [Fibrisoma limi BUZ 3]